MKNLIIEAPSLRPLPNRIGWAFFTALFWLLWVYLCIPLITLFLWGFGFSLFDRHFLNLTAQDLVDMQDLVVLYAIVIIALGGALLSWAGTEFMRFRNVHKRHEPLPVETKELAEFAHFPPEKITELRSARRMVAHHDEHGKFLYADITQQSE